MKAAASKLKAELIESGITENSVVFEGGINVAIVTFPNAGCGVLTQNLVLRGGLKASDFRRRNADAKERSVAGVPALIDTPGP